MEIKILDIPFSICKVKDFSAVDLQSEFCFVARTDEENSLVCPTADVPRNAIQQDDGWRAFRIQGVLDFSLVGILAAIAGTLSQNGIGLFAISTYNTDYILTKAIYFSKAVELLRRQGYTIV